IQRLRDLTRLRQALRHDRTRWAQRLQAVLAHEGWPCARRGLLTGSGQRWLTGLSLAPRVRSLVDAHLAMIDAIAGQMQALDSELRALARADRRLLALQTIDGVGPIVACHLLAEIGDARRFRRARQLVRAAGLDPVVHDSAETKPPGKPSKQGSPQLRGALVQAAHQTARRAAAPSSSAISQSANESAASAPHSPARARSSSAPTTSSRHSTRPRASRNDVNDRPNRQDTSVGELPWAPST